jgi:sortase (surface protein transpeptidase)
MFPRLTVAIGITLIAASIYLYMQRLTPVNLEISSYTPIKRVSNAGYESIDTITPYPPQYIEIPDLKIKLPIIPSKITGGKWETTSKGVSYLETSPIPGEKGNSILYGHNWEKLLGRLVKIKTGAKIVITYSDSSILNQTEDERMTIYTCTGFLDSMRFIVVAFPEKSRLTLEQK